MFVIDSILAKYLPNGPSINALAGAGAGAGAGVAAGEANRLYKRNIADAMKIKKAHKFTANLMNFPKVIFKRGVDEKDSN